MGLNFTFPKLNMPEMHFETAAENFAENISDQVKRLRMKLASDQDFIGEVAFGVEVITIGYISAAGRDTVRLFGRDGQGQECQMFAHVACLNVLFRITKTTEPEEKRKYGFVVDLSHENAEQPSTD
jgi:hypothetical protein